MRLAQVLPGAAAAASSDEVEQLAYDHRKVGRGAMFFCPPGRSSDGHEFAADAVARGAVAVVVERPLGLGVPELQVSSGRATMALAASAFHRDPTARLQTVPASWRLDVDQVLGLRSVRIPLRRAPRRT